MAKKRKAKAEDISPILDDEKMLHQELDRRSLLVRHAIRRGMGAHKDARELLMAKGFVSAAFALSWSVEGQLVYPAPLPWLDPLPYRTTAHVPTFTTRQVYAPKLFHVYAADLLEDNGLDGSIFRGAGRSSLEVATNPTQVEAYIETILTREDDISRDCPLSQHHTAIHIGDDAKWEIQTDVQRFWSENMETVASALQLETDYSYNGSGEIRGAVGRDHVIRAQSRFVLYGNSEIGRRFWVTRQRHSLWPTGFPFYASAFIPDLGRAACNFPRLSVGVREPAARPSKQEKPKTLYGPYEGLIYFN